MSVSNDGNNKQLEQLPYSRYCHIVKRIDFDGYGFNLHSEKVKPGQYIGKVDESSPAELAGLKEGDRILEVNGVPIGNETHKQVVQRIKAIACEVRLLLIDPKLEKLESSISSKSQNNSHKSNDDETTDGSESNGIPNRSESYANSTLPTSLPASGESNVQRFPGRSSNISTISMISTKRVPSSLSNNRSSVASDATDNSRTNNSNGNLVTTPDSDGQKLDENVTESETTMPETLDSNINSKKSNDDNNSINNNSSSNNHNVNKANITSSTYSDGLNLPLTAAEMRAKLMAKKKFDAKNDSLDLKKKFEIIQKL